MRNQSKDRQKYTLKIIQELFETARSGTNKPLDADTLNTLISQCTRVQENLLRLKIFNELENETGESVSRSEPETPPEVKAHEEDNQEESIADPGSDRKEEKQPETDEEQPETPREEKVEHPAAEEEKEEIEEETEDEPPAPEENDEEVSEKSEPASRESINDKISLDPQKGLADKLSQRPISDLKEAVGLNERFLFSNELFNGNMEAFNRALNELNHLETQTDAERYLNEQLSVQYGWDPESETVEKFINLIRRRFIKAN